MRYINKNRWVPKQGRKLNIDNIQSITHLIHNQLNEKYHVYNKDNKDYNPAIKQALLQCILQYKQDQLLVYFNHQYYTYAPIKCTFDNCINTVYIYMCIGDNENIYNIAYNDNHEIDFFKSHIEKKLVINRKTKKIEFKDVEVFDKASVICACTDDILDLQNIDYYIGAVRHELIHILHETRKKIINVYAGESDYYAAKLSSTINIEFPFWKYLKSINTENPTTKDFILIISACIYYLDTSEYSAWLDNYYSQLMEVFQYKRYITDDESPNIMVMPLAYQIMMKINIVLTTSKDQIIKFFDFNTNTSYTDIVKEYISKVGIPNKTAGILIMHYIKRSNTFLKKCELIFKREFKEHYLIDFNQ